MSVALPSRSIPDPALAECDEMHLLGRLLYPRLHHSELPRTELRRLLGRRGLAHLLEHPQRACSEGRRVLEAAAEIARRHQPRITDLAAPIVGPDGALPHLHDLREAPTEMVAALLLDSRNRLIRRLTVSAGGLNTATLDPRDVYAPALAERCAAIVLAHNHPSGDPSASSADVATTRRMAEAGALLGIDLLDHLIVVRRGYLSLRESGLL